MHWQTDFQLGGADAWQTKSRHAADAVAALQLGRGQPLDLHGARRRVGANQTK